MSPNPYSLDDADPFGYARRRMKALSPSIPPAAINSSGASQGFSTDDPGDDSSWWKPQLDPAANRISSLPGLSSSGPAGTGQSAQPQAKMADGDLSAGAGNVLNGPPKRMPPPGMPAPSASDDPGAAGVAAEQPQAQLPPGVTPQMKAIQDRQQQLVNNPPRMIGSRPQDFDQTTGKEKIGAKVASWGQRLAMAILSAGKLAPYAQQIVHPDYTQQVEANAAEQKGLQGELANQEKIQSISTAASAQQAAEGLKDEQAALAKAKADPHYGMREIDADYAKENLPWKLPEIGADGKPHYFIDKAEESNLSKPIPPDKFVSIPEGGSLYDTGAGKIVATGAPKEKPLVEGEMPLGQRIPQLNQMLTSRYQILHPGKPLPAQYGLPPNATQKDYDRIDKGLEAEERAQGNLSQQAVASEMRRTTQAIAQSNSDFQHSTILTKPHEKAFEDANTQLEKINDAQLMVKGGAIDQALGVPKVMTALVSGAGSGVRVTQAELNAIGHARGISGDVEGTIRSWLGQGKLTPQQQSQLTDVLENVKQRVIQKRGIANDAILGIRGAPDTTGMIAADNTARKKIMDLESGPVKMRAPDGSIAMVDATHVEMAKSKGAVVVQ